MWFQPRILVAPRERSLTTRVLVPILSLSAALYLRQGLVPWIGPELPFAFLLPATFLSAWFGGLWAGLAATFVGAVLGLQFYDHPFSPAIPRDLTQLLLFVANGMVITALCSALHRAVRNIRTAQGEAARTFEIMANNAPVLIWSTNAVGRYSFVNENWRSFTGLSLAPDAENRPGQLHPADAARYATVSAEAIAARRPFQIEYRLRRADGSYRWLIEHAVPRYNPEGEFEGYIGSCSDITDSRHEREELAFITRVQTALAESLDLDRCAEVLVQAFLPRFADWCSIQLVDDEGRLSPVRVHHMDQPAHSAPPFDPGRFAPAPADSFAQGIAESGEAQLVCGLDAALLRAIAYDESHYARLQRLGTISYLGVPLRARGRIIGVLSLATAESGRTLDENEQRLVQKIAGLAGFALENARLYRSARQALAAEEHALREMQRSERRFRFMWEANIFGIGTISRSGRIRSANPALAELLSYSADDIAAGRASLSERTPAAWRAADERATLELELTGRCTPFEKEFVRPDGSVVPVLVCGSLLPDTDECMTFVLDLGPQRRAEKALGRHQLLLQTIIDAMPAMVAYIDSGERFRLHNEKYRKWLGLEGTEIDGRTIREVFGEESYKRITPYLRSALRGRNMRHETTLRTADRERHLICSYRPDRDADGGVCGVVLHAYDITERKETEQALAEALTRYRFLADAMPQMIWTSLPDGHLDYVNHRWLETTGMTELQSLGHDGWLDAVHPEDRAATQERWEEALVTCMPFEHECRLRCGRAEAWRWHLVRALPRSDGESVVQWVGSATDIDEQRRAYAELADARARLKSHAEELEGRVRARTATLREANAELEAFTYSVSHDLRTPLQFVRGFADAIRSDTGNRLSEDSADYLQRIIRAATRMDTIIQDLLAYSRFARAEMQLRDVSLDDVVGDVLAHHNAMIKQVHAVVSVEPGLPLVVADRTGLFQSISNLVSNALKFTRPGCVPTIRIRSERNMLGARLWIEDDGIGIDPRHHERIFKLFERLHSPAEYPGTGIGLSLVRKAITRMGGQCGVESAPGEGARFWIDFPTACPVGALSHASI